MNRRELATTVLLGGLAAAAVPTAAVAQMGRVGRAEEQHAMDTLRVGGLALRTSEMAQRQPMRHRAREFADFEVDEQTTIARIIQERTGMAPPPPDAKARAVMDRLRGSRGRAFEMNYVMAQIDGHNELLAIQERYLANGRDQHARHVAMLARGQIKEHLRLLADIRAGRA